MNRPFFTIVGFFLFSLGVLSLILSLVGLKLTFLDAIYNQGVLTVLIQLCLLFGGMIILYLSRVGKATDAGDGSET
jgi:hypothetical protein